MLTQRAGGVEFGRGIVEWQNAWWILMRDRDYHRYLDSIFDFDDRVKTAAEYAGKANELLEAVRDELWKKEGDVIG